ncbi:hypothetical protein Sthe_2951 [Sphaerobacter thermophilus DSM 20745]|uniref:Uncharacterized protein n=1 Tax=Sphaerobacter thermophilus (strain ATCC 49802 / DSM 20745 / KCCM 41009 / NCIMB 13125 / S 6022) TaxID=479434 RepID=D1C962_SPHTD|nr:hypothetical protein Sthe_2951 [Sphaerobacter thermophilus DSM 20745]
MTTGHSGGGAWLPNAQAEEESAPGANGGFPGVRRASEEEM